MNKKSTSKRDVTTRKGRKSTGGRHVVNIVFGSFPKKNDFLLLFSKKSKASELTGRQKSEKKGRPRGMLRRERDGKTSGNE